MPNTSGLTEAGYRFGQFEVLMDLPRHETLMSCSQCDTDCAYMVQFRYCGTRGALCGPCLRMMQRLLWADLSNLWRVH